MVGSTFSSVRVASFGYKNLVKRELIFSRKREEEACREATSSPEKLAEEGRVEASIRSRSAPNSLSHLAATTGARPWRWWMVKQWHPRRSTPLDPRRRAPPPPTHLARPPTAQGRPLFSVWEERWCREPSSRLRRALSRFGAPPMRKVSTRGKLERRERREKKMVKLALVGPTRSNFIRRYFIRL